MSVTIMPVQQTPSVLQQLTGTEPRTVIRDSSTTEIVNVPGGAFDVGTALRNGGIGAAVGAALGGVSLLGKVALPIIGRVASVAGLTRVAMLGGAVGVATAAAPLVVPALRRSQAARAAATGAAIGAAAGAILPLVSVPFGAVVGAGVGLLVHWKRTHPTQRDCGPYPGYDAYPGFAPYGMGNAPAPAGMVPVTPNFGAYAGTAMNPWGSTLGYGMVNAGFPQTPGMYGMVAPYGAGMQLAAQAQGPVGTPQPAVSRPAVGARRVVTSAKTFRDGAGNIRRVGSGTIVRAARATASTATAPLADVGAPVSPVAAGTLPPRPTA